MFGFVDEVALLAEHKELLEKAVTKVRKFEHYKYAFTLQELQN